MVKNAGFDRVLVRPRSTIIQVLGSGFDIKRAGHLIQAVIVLIIAMSGVNIQWGSYQGVDSYKHDHGRNLYFFRGIYAAGGFFFLDD